MAKVFERRQLHGPILHPFFPIFGQRTPSMPAPCCSALDAQNLFERVQRLCQIALMLHDGVNVFVRARNFIDHAAVFATHHALGLRHQVLHAHRNIERDLLKVRCKARLST